MNTFTFLPPPKKTIIKLMAHLQNDTEYTEYSCIAIPHFNYSLLLTVFFFLKLFKILFSIAKTSVVSICFVCSKVVPISNAMNITS